MRRLVHLLLLFAALAFAIPAGVRAASPATPAQQLNPRRAQKAEPPVLPSVLVKRLRSGATLFTESKPPRSRLVTLGKATPSRYESHLDY